MIADKKRKILEKSLPNNSLLLLIGKGEILRNGDVFYPFRQDSDFLLLTGLNIPDIKVIARNQESKIEWIIYSDPISEKEKIWGTNRISYEEIREKSGISQVRSLDEWEGDIDNAMKDAGSIFVRRSDEKLLEQGFMKYRNKFVTLDNLILPLRMRKTEEEIEKMRQAITVTKIALDVIQKNINTYSFEREIEGDIASIYRSHGCTEAYPTIVASGSNACMLHYTGYSRKIDEGDFILIDTGAEFEGYAADITRTFMKGEISARKREIYDAVKHVQSEAIDSIKPGRTWDEHEGIMREIMNRHLEELGFLPKNINREERDLLSRKYFPHRMSHFLGLDVHDSGDRSNILEPGMVITVEPGIYLRDEAIGVRIEDDILITRDGCEVLSREIPK